jgi:hypothetical protein
MTLDQKPIRADDGAWKAQLEAEFFERLASKTKGSASHLQLARRCQKSLREGVTSYLSYFKQTSSW